MSDEEKNVGNGATDGAELDIMESNSVKGQEINHAIHWDGYGDDHQSTGTSIKNSGTYDGEFHTFGFLWTETSYIWYIDGVETYRIEEGMSNWPGSSTAAAYILLSIEFGTWADTMDESAFTDSVLFDYVRVYQKAN